MSPSIRKVVDAARAKLRRPKGARADAPTPAKATPPRERGIRAGWRRFRRATDRYRLLTDVVGAVLIVAILIGGLAAATGGVWPPVVVVESGSMMHAYEETSYGRLGTIDVGDMVFVRATTPADIETWAEGGPEHYGRPGDVIAYWPGGNRDPDTNKTIIHRAIAWVEVENNVTQITYRLYWANGETRTWDSRGIYFPPLGFSEENGFSPRNGYRPTYSGFLTKGDNAYSNPATDQALGISRMVDPTWIVGEVYGEVPWMGLAKLALQSGQTNPEVPGWERIGNAFAPLELWSMFFLTLAILILVPLALDTYRAWRMIQREQETTRRIEEENRKRMEARRAAQAAAANGKKVTTFAQIVSSRPLSQASGRPPPPGR